MTLLHTARFSSWARGHLRCRMDGVSDRFALTYDDGPNARATGALLDLLGERGARATFFVLGPNLRRLPSLMRRMVHEGHEVALHGDHHLPLAVMPPWAIRSSLLGCARSVMQVCGVRPRHYRPAFGFMMPGQSAYVRSLGFIPVLGDVYPEDPVQPGVQVILDRVLPRLTGGSVLILHDGSPFGDCDRGQTLLATARLLEHTAAAGLRATTVAELFAEEDRGHA
jgi:peptidoglycan/xylan/chitin deacetylase (PgdA/CDA1 family)